MCYSWSEQIFSVVFQVNWVLLSVHVIVLFLVGEYMFVKTISGLWLLINHLLVAVGSPTRIFNIVTSWMNWNHASICYPNHSIHKSLVMIQKEQIRTHLLSWTCSYFFWRFSWHVMLEGSIYNLYSEVSEISAYVQLYIRWLLFVHNIFYLLRRWFFPSSLLTTKCWTKVLWHVHLQ
jgi:hypothetical protein